MLHDPTDETHRKPRQFRNTPLQKYVRFASLFITLWYAGAMFISYKRNVVPLLNDEEYIASHFNEDQKDKLRDSIASPFFRNTIEKLFKEQRAKLTVEVESKDSSESKEAN